VWQSDVPRFDELGGLVLPYGQGRSYGDVCLNHGGILLDTSWLDRFIAFDPASGVLRCEGGTTLASILQFVLVHHWFLAVTPGTKFVSVGGAIANDVHGRNHHRAGTFGCHVRQLELLRSNGERIVCSPTTRRDLFAATIGGLGLTGLILWAEIQLRPVPGPEVAMERVRFDSLGGFFELAVPSLETHEYLVAWVDVLTRGRRKGRGVLLRGKHAEGAGTNGQPRRPPTLGSTFGLRAALLDRRAARLVNAVYFHNNPSRATAKHLHYEDFFYPLDAVHAWKRVYGRLRLLQYHCVLPGVQAEEALREILDRIARSGEAAALGVLKLFGPNPSPGLLSFPRSGASLAVDFGYRGGRTLALLDELDTVVLQADGAVNPAKDARMSADSFAAGFPRWHELARSIDPCFSSSFWRRVTERRT
jgi:FAD/FMN-containing dehydrogenase